MKRPCAVLWWHFHQPDYREPMPADAGSAEPGLATFPWVRMHAMRGYTDLVEQAIHRGPRGMTFNMVPSLADQLEDAGRGRVVDHHLRAARRLLLGDDAARQDAFDLHAVPTPRPIVELYRFGELQGLRQKEHVATRQEAIDACVLFHLAWCGFTAAERPEVAALYDRQRNYDEGDLKTVLDLSLEMSAEVLPRMARALADGAIHLSVTPYTHPILPLLINTESAHEATSDGGAPPPFRCPEDARRQVRDARARHLELFGEDARIAWPAEGSLSEEAAWLLHDEGIEVAASDEDLLRKSLALPGFEGHHHDLDHAPHLTTWKHPSGLHLLFRDRALSDDWGFVYRDLDPQVAAQAFVAGVITRSAEHRTVSVILDGENPFEHYPGAGRDHLDAFAQQAEHLDLISPRAAADRPSRTLARVATGSWIGASFDIWAGDDEDRRAWKLLKLVREAIDLDKLDEKARKRAETHLFAAEGSDWFWWFGPEFSIPDKGGFDALFRRHLEEAALAAGLGQDIIERLQQPISRKRLAERSRNPLPFGRPRPEEPPLGAWINALRLDDTSADQGSMHQGAPLLERAALLTSRTTLHLRVDARDDATRVEITIDTPSGPHRVVRTVGTGPTNIDIPWGQLLVAEGQTIGMVVEVFTEEGQSQSAPAGGPVELTRPLATWFEA